MIIILIIGLTVGISLGIKRRKGLNKYWCRLSIVTAKKWKLMFPNASNGEIREFLEAFVNAFAFNSKKRLKFEPDDKVVDVYKALYPDLWANLGCDALELETFVGILEDKYHFDLVKNWKEDLTLGQIFAETQKSEDKPQSEMNKENVSIINIMVIFPALFLSAVLLTGLFFWIPIGMDSRDAFYLLKLSYWFPSGIFLLFIKLNSQIPLTVAGYLVYLSIFIFALIHREKQCYKIFLLVWIFLLLLNMGGCGLTLFDSM